MDDTSQNKLLLDLAAKYVWWTPPDVTLAGNIPHLVASVMERGSWDDAAALLGVVGRGAFLQVLSAPPAGTLSDRSLAFWHYRLGQTGAAPKSRRRFGQES